MPKVSASIQSAAAPDKVWELIVDLPRYPEWLLIHDAFISDVPERLAEAATFKQRVRMMGSPADIAWKVIAADGPGWLEMAGDGPMSIKAFLRFKVAPVDDGSSVTLDLEFNGPMLNGPIVAVVEQSAAALAGQSMDKFKDLLD